MFTVNLHPNEKLKKIHRQAEVTLAKPALLILVLIYAPWAFLIKYELDYKFRNLLLVWTIFIFLFGLNRLLLWMLNSYLVTSQRLIAVIYRNLFSKQVIETPVERILNISFRKHGLWETLFNFGDVEIQIVGLVDPLVFKNVKDPEEVKDSLWQAHMSLTPKTEKTFDPAKVSEIQMQIGYQHKRAGISGNAPGKIKRVI